MALPIVTYGKYNYGQYANPTPIRYKGGFGEALTGAVQAISTAEKKKGPSGPFFMKKFSREEIK